MKPTCSEEPELSTPNISKEDLLHLAEDTEKLESIKNAKEIRLLIIGNTGTGKSTLINGLIGEEVAEVRYGLQTSGVTRKVEPYERMIAGIKVVIYDSPGFYDGTGQDKAYLNELYRLCHEGIDLVMFAIGMENRSRFTKDHLDAKSNGELHSSIQTINLEQSYSSDHCG